jgi:hypothetical protein
MRSLGARWGRPALAAPGRLCRAAPRGGRAPGSTSSSSGENGSTFSSSTRRRSSAVTLLRTFVRRGWGVTARAVAGPARVQRGQRERRAEGCGAGPVGRPALEGGHVRGVAEDADVDPEESFGAERVQRCRLRQTQLSRLPVQPKRAPRARQLTCCTKWLFSFQIWYSAGEWYPPSSSISACPPRRDRGPARVNTAAPAAGGARRSARRRRQPARSARGRARPALPRRPLRTRRRAVHRAS